MVSTKTTKKSTAGDRYTESIGRRKTALARVRMTPSTRTVVTVNKKDINEYFVTEPLRVIALEPFLKVTLPIQFEIEIVVRGGGIAGQAVAVCHAISRALNEYDQSLRAILKKEGFLKRDARMKERRKPGLVKARKRKQWSKR